MYQELQGGSGGSGVINPTNIENESYTDASSLHTFSTTSGKTYVISFSKRDIITESGLVVNGGSVVGFFASPSYTFNSNTIYGYQIFIKATGSSVSIKTGASYHNMLWQVTQLD